MLKRGSPGIRNSSVHFRDYTANLVAIFLTLFFVILGYLGTTLELNLKILGLKSDFFFFHLYKLGSLMLST